VADADEDREAAAWAELVAAYGEELPVGDAVPWPDAENVPGGDAGDAADGPGPGPGDADSDGTDSTDADRKKPARLDPALLPPPGVIVVHPVISGPRDYSVADDPDDDHYEPPEPPPLPSLDVTGKFAWIAVLGGPLLIFGYVVSGTPMPWWALLIGIAGFLGGFGTLIARMRTDDEVDDRPDGGAVV
jgi:hypothetical protein